MKKFKIDEIGVVVEKRRPIPRTQGTRIWKKVKEKGGQKERTEKIKGDLKLYALLTIFNYYRVLICIIYYSPFLNFPFPLLHASSIESIKMVR